MIRAVAIFAMLFSADLAVAQTHARADVTACFVPAERCTGQIVAALDDSKTEIRVQAFAFSSRPIATALVAAHRRGVDVQIVLDRSNQRFRGGVSESVATAGVPVFVDCLSLSLGWGPGFSVQ